jgi:glycosidase
MFADLRNLAITIAVFGSSCGAAPTIDDPAPPDEVAYRVLVRSFFDSDADGVGDLPGLLEKLDVLNDGAAGGDDLGVDVLVLMPLGPSLDAIGYHTLDQRAIAERLGTEEDVRRLADAVHARSMRLVVELPLSEVSVAHPLFQTALTDLESDAGEWFRWRDTDPEWKQPWEGSQQTTWHPSPRGFYYAAFGRELPQLRVESPVVRAELLETIHVWRNRGVDGVQITSASLAVPTGPGPAQWNTEATVEFWSALAREVQAEAPAFTVWLDVQGSADVGERYLAAHPGLRVVAPGFSDALVRAVRQGSGTPFRVDADLRPSGGYVLALDGPNQRRVAEDLRAKPDWSRNALVTQLTLPGTPELFYGQAVGMRHNDQLSDLNRLSPLAWTGDAPTYGFTAASRAWQPFGAESEQRNQSSARAIDGSTWNVVRELIELRGAHPALATGELSMLTPGDNVAPVVAYARTTANETLVIAVNVSERPVSVGPVLDGATGGRVIWGDEGVGPAVAGDDGLRFVLPPLAAAVWSVTR